MELIVPYYAKGTEVGCSAHRGKKVGQVRRNSKKYRDMPRGAGDMKHIY